MGLELQANIKRYNLQQRDHLYLTKSVQCRFNCNTYYQKAQNPAIATYMSKHGTNKKLGLQIHTYSNEGNPSGAISLRCFKKATGTYQGTQQYLGGINIKNMSELLEDIANKGSKSSLFRCGAEP